MKIGFFSDSYFPEIDGVTYTLKTWKERLEDRGHEVYIIYPDSEKYEPGSNEIPINSVGNPFYEGYNIPLPTSIDFPELDIVHCHSPGPIGIAGRLYSSRKNIPSVYTHHTPLEEYVVQAIKVEKIADLIGNLYVPLEEKFLSKFSLITSNTDGGRRDNEMIKLAAGIDMEFFQKVDSDWSLDRPVAGYSGRISNEKNVELLLEMAEGFKGTVVIVGEGPQKNSLMDKAPDNVVFKDFLERENLPGFYSMLDVFVTASTGDTLGLSPLEANACGTPVVAPDVHPFDSTIGPDNGNRFSNGDVDDLIKKIEKTLSQTWETRESVKQYSVDEKIDRLEEMYRDLSKEV